MSMASNRGVAYMGPGKVEVQSIDFPKLALGSRKCEHGVILKIVTTNICGSDQHMVRGRTTAPKGLVLGHEITGEVIEAGRDVEFVKVGDLVSVPFNIACGRCHNCKEGKTGICLHVNPARPCKHIPYRKVNLTRATNSIHETTPIEFIMKETAVPAKRKGKRKAAVAAKRKRAKRPETPGRPKPGSQDQRSEVGSDSRIEEALLAWRLAEARRRGV